MYYISRYIVVSNKDMCIVMEGKDFLMQKWQITQKRGQNIFKDKFESLNLVISRVNFQTFNLGCSIG